MAARLRFSPEPLDVVRIGLQKNGYVCFVIAGKAVVDKPSFLAAASAALPADPPFGSSPNWDGFTDSLWGGIDQLDVPQIAILWHDADQMASSDPTAFATAIVCLLEVAHDVSDLSTGIGRKVELALVLLGNRDILSPFV